jgi:uncharacterized protein
VSGSSTKQLLVLVAYTDTWHERPLYEAIVAALQKSGVAGASVFPGTMGYGSHGYFHRRDLFGVSAEKPVAILAIDAEAKLRTAAEAIRPMVREGLMAMSDIEVLLQVPERGGQAD